MNNPNPCVLVPTYNNARTLRDVMLRIFASCDLPVYVVNDGATDATADILAQLKEAYPDRLTLLRHDVNRGKAAALFTGFDAARAAGITHAITVDSDDQLRPEELPDMIAALQANPQALIVGCRDVTKADYPAKSRFGRRVSNSLIFLESGQTVGDSQCGYRVYPLELFEHVKCGAGYFGFEAEIITRAIWAGCPIVEVPVTCRYLPPGQRVTHFKPGLDSFRAIRMHARLLLRAMLPWPGPQWPVRERDDELRGVPMWRLWGWVSPFRAWRQLRKGSLKPMSVATALGVGVFIGCTPFFGVQLPLSVLVAHRLKLHPLAVVTGANISVPPIGVLIVIASIITGHWLLHGQMLDLSELDWQSSQIFQTAVKLLAQWLLGSVIVGGVLALLVFVISLCVLRFIPAKPAQA